MLNRKLASGMKKMSFWVSNQSKRRFASSQSNLRVSNKRRHRRRMAKDSLKAEV
jgi:hypothetical protein